MKNDISNMMALDIYLSSMSNEAYDKIENQIKSQMVQSMPLLSWDLFSQQHQNTLKKLKRNQDIIKIVDMAEKLKWKNDIQSMFEENPFEALIVTDLRRNIIWVNDGFTEMTGYHKNEALNRTPAFLQGSKTSAVSRTRFSEKLSSGQPFKEIITNYRKTSEPYECEVKIFPLYNKENTHFIALERQVG